MKVIGRTASIVVLEESLSFIQILFQEVSIFGELLFLITEAIRFEFPRMLKEASNKIKSHNFKNNQILRCTLQVDMFELLGKSTIEHFKMKDMVKIQKIGEKTFNSSVRVVNKAVNHFIQEFERYKKGKVTFRRKKEVDGVCEEEIEER